MIGSCFFVRGSQKRDGLWYPVDVDGRFGVFGWSVRTVRAAVSTRVWVWDLGGCGKGFWSRVWCVGGVVGWCVCFFLSCCFR